MSERRCILSGERADPALLVRLAIAPDGLVAPDVRAKAPGRGAWVGVARAQFEDALASGKLKGALARAFQDGALRVEPDLGARIEGALRAALLDRFGLEARSSNVLTGSEKIEVAARKGQVRMLLHAADAAADGMRKLDRAWRVGEEAEGTEMNGRVIPLDRHALAGAMGRANVVHVAVTDKGAAERIGAMLDRWQNFCGYANGDNHLPAHGAADVS